MSVGAAAPNRAPRDEAAPKTKAPEPDGRHAVAVRMPAIDSEAIAQVEYEAASRTLFVRFTSGEWYAYLDVPPPVFDTLLAAESKGGFFQAKVRDRYAFVRLDRP